MYSAAFESVLKMWRSKRKQVHKPFYRENPGSSPAFTGIYREVLQDLLGSFLEYFFLHREIPGKAGELTGKARDLPGYRRAPQEISPPLKKIPRDITGELPVNFQFPGKSLLLGFAWNVTYTGG